VGGARVVFCTTCKNRLDHLAKTLPKNVSDNPSARTVLLDYNSQDGLEDWVKTYNGRRDLLGGNLVVYKFTEPSPFRMAHAKNLAHRLGILEGGEVLVNLDADNYAGHRFDLYLGEQFEAPDVFLWSRMVKGEMRRGISGRIAVTRDAFLLSGGYDEVFAKWGPDDKDFNVRLRRLGFEGKEIDPKFLEALTHNDKMRFREYPEVRTLVKDGVYHEGFNLESRADVTVANAGKVGCGVVYRNYEGGPVEVGPLPSRVFGVGMHKTATVSLHKAFEALGIRSAHWPSAHWAKAVYREMNEVGRSATLEKVYAACDLPLTLLYQQLDKAYPGSKFVLTVRDEDKWVESVRKHWNPATNPFRDQWDTDPFTHRVHQVLYGRQDFDAETMLARYRRHNQEVRDYFRGRPQDLLVMDFDQGAGWYELCGFLKLPLPKPKRPFPRENRSKET
jgi:hypothetical protein